MAASEWRDFSSLPEMEISSQFGWLVNLVYEIELNELLPHKGRITRIQRETSHEVREIFVTQLHDKFIRVREIIRALNRRLRNHRFGRQTYILSQRENAEMAPLLRLVREVSRNPREAEQILFAAGGEFGETLDRIRDIFRTSGNAELYEDYRQYYRFDLAITNDVLPERFRRQNVGRGSCAMISPSGTCIPMSCGSAKSSWSRTIISTPSWRRLRASPTKSASRLVRVRTVVPW